MSQHSVRAETQAQQALADTRVATASNLRAKVGPLRLYIGAVPCHGEPAVPFDTYAAPQDLQMRVGHPNSDCSLTLGPARAPRTAFALDQRSRTALAPVLSLLVRRCDDQRSLVVPP
mmetsp:Transcript_52159/g.135274  ORF Transcript_52159/g.135274 Transcript_52159/m.135274 type:complete len:117 (+) Transcript_52159:270-620(+)